MARLHTFRKADGRAEVADPGKPSQTIRVWLGDRPAITLKKLHTSVHTPQMVVDDLGDALSLWDFLDHYATAPTRTREELWTAASLWAGDPGGPGIHDHLPGDFGEDRDDDDVSPAVRPYLDIRLRAPGVRFRYMYRARPVGTRVWYYTDTRIKMRDELAPWLRKLRVGYAALQQEHLCVPIPPVAFAHWLTARSIKNDL